MQPNTGKKTATNWGGTKSDSSWLFRSYDKQYYEANRDRWKNKVFDKSAQKAQFLTRKERHAEWLSTSPEIKVCSLFLANKLQSQIEEALNISDPSDWYNVTQKQLRCTPHGMLISKYFTRQEFLQVFDWWSRSN